MKNVPCLFVNVNTNGLEESRLFKKYTDESFIELEKLALMFGFKIVDRYWTYDRDFKNHVVALPLFDTTQMTTGEKVDHLHRLLKAKCKVYYVSLGINQSEHGNVAFSIHGMVRSHKGQNFVISKPAEDFSDMLSKMIESLQTIDDK